MSKKTKPKSSSTLDKKAIDKDYAAFCKKHNLEKAILIVEHEKSVDKKTAEILIDVSIKNGKGEKALCESLSKLIKTIGGLNTKNINGITSILKDVESMMLADQIKNHAANITAAMLSKENKKKLEVIKSLKNKLVQQGKLEEASKVREAERSILGMNQPNMSASEIDAIIEFYNK